VRTSLSWRKAASSSQGISYTVITSFHNMSEPKIHYRVHKIQPLNPLLRHFNPLPNITPYSLKIHLLLSSKLCVSPLRSFFPSEFSAEVMYFLLFLNMAIRHTFVLSPYWHLMMRIHYKASLCDISVIALSQLNHYISYNCSLTFIVRFSSIYVQNFQVVSSFQVFRTNIFMYFSFLSYKLHTLPTASCLILSP
jgi:hypothetical protein